MRGKRLEGDGEVNVYHCILKVPDRTPGNHEFAFGEPEKQHMQELVEELQQVYLVEVVAWCHMSTHSHLICVQRREALKELGREELRKRFKLHLKGQRVGRKALEHLDLRSREARHFAKRINSVSSFCGVLEQRFTQWYNRRKGHRGSVWNPRFKSVLLKSLKAVLRCIQYVELNPVRAHMVHHAKEYRHNSFYLVSGRSCEKREGMRHKLIAVLRCYGGWLREEWSDGRYLRLYRAALDEISDLPHNPAQDEGLLMCGHCYWSGSGGVVAIGGDEKHLRLETRRSGADTCRLIELTG